MARCFVNDYEATNSAGNGRSHFGNKIRRTAVQVSEGTDKAGETEKIEQKNFVDKLVCYPVKNDKGM